MKKRGFTIVELIITITIMGILLVLAVVNLSTTQVKARDDERRSDIESLAYNLETFFKTGKASGSTLLGRYPSNGLMSTADPLANLRVQLPDLDFKAATAPGKSSPIDSLIMATDTTVPSPNIDHYVYQPLQQDGSLCTLSSQICIKYNLYYTLESNTSTVQTYMSKNQ